MKKRNRFPPGWDEQRVRAVLEHYEAQTEEEAVAEDEAAYEDAAPVKRPKRIQIDSCIPVKTKDPMRKQFAIQLP